MEWIIFWIPKTKKILSFNHFLHNQTTQINSPPPNLNLLRIYLNYFIRDQIGRHQEKKGMDENRRRD